MQRFPLTAVQVQAPIMFAIGMMLGAVWYFLIDFEPSLLALLGASGTAALILFIVKFRLAASRAAPLAWVLFGVTIGAL